MIVTCLECGTIKRFRISRHQLWSMQPEAWKIAPNGIVDNLCRLETNADSSMSCSDVAV